MGEAAEVAAEVVEESIDGVVETLLVARNNPVVLSIVGATGLIAGGVGGYFIAKSRLRSFYEDLAAGEIADAKEFYANLNKVSPDGAVLTPMDVMEQRHGVDAAAEALRGYSGRVSTGPVATEEELMTDEQLDERQMQKIEQARLHSLNLVPEADPSMGSHPITVVRETAEMRTTEAGSGVVLHEEKVETTNMFTDPTFDLEEEMKFRTEDKPYIITHDEFFENDKDFENLSLTYYQVDDTLTGEHDTPVEAEELIGEDHLVRFGSGSKDKNIVYIRNEKLKLDFEVIRSTGSYLEEVLGLADESENSLKHSDQRDARRALRHSD